jgi:hypothetical protein
MAGLMLACHFYHSRETAVTETGLQSWLPVMWLASLTSRMALLSIRALPTNIGFKQISTHTVLPLACVSLDQCRYAVASTAFLMDTPATAIGSLSTRWGMC